MHSVTLSRLDDTGIVERQRSLRNRQYSVYASRIRPSAAPPSLEAAPAPDRVSTGLELLPASLSPRWDSLSNGPHLINNSPTSPGAVAGDAPWSELPFQEFVASPVRPVYGPWQQATDAMADPSCTSPRLAASKTMALRTDGRLSDPVPVENFSRPRKPSIRQLQPAIPEQSASGPAVPRLTALVPTDLLAEIGLPTPKTPPWPSSPRPSALPCKSLSPFSPLGPPPVELPDPKHSRVRNAAGASLTAVRSAFTAPASLPMAAGGAPPPWVAADELRSSFRSQLTASTAFGTTVTERSSVLTKDSSVNSLYASVDEPSLEDVMRMYEKGFADDEDDGDEDAGDDDQDDDDDDDQRGRTLIFTTDDPIVSRSDDAADLATVMSASAAQHVDDIDDAGPPVPPVRSTLDAEIRQSRMIFTSLAFTSSVPALCASAQLDVAEKRDSGKSLDSEPSVASDPTVADDTSSTKPESMVPPPSAPLSPMAAFRAALEPEDPGSRDRYGFKKQNQFITREQYDTWNKGYTQYLSRRHKKWVAYLRECSLMTDRPIRFPPPNAKTKRFVRKGIPPDWRGAAWFYYAGGSAILAKHSGLYEKLLVRKAKEVDADAIERDLHRTFPDNIQFQPSPPAEGESPAESPSEPPIISSLRRVLHAFALYNPRIGYCQSLNFLAGLLLLFVETEEQCFWLLNVITIIYLPGTHEMSLEGSKVDLGVLMTELRDTMPAVWDKIGGELESGSMANNKLARKPRPMLRRRDLPHLSTERLPPITLCMTAWFMSCYIGTLPIETTLRVWDVFFYEGSKTLFRIALSIFKSGEAEIKAVADPMEMFGVVQSLPRRMLDANGLMETCFKRRNGFGHLSQDVIDERRQERRDRARQDQALRTGKPIPSGNVTEAETETARRKGNLFGMKLRDGSRTRAAEV